MSINLQKEAMKHLLLLLLISLIAYPKVYAQYEYEPNKEYPFGQLHPDAPEQVGDYAPLIGKSSCSSESRAPDGSWNNPVDMFWTFKYIMNGKAVQDETLKADGSHSGSIRQFNADSTKWYVHYYSSSSAPPVLASWEGGIQESGNMILYREQAAPNGTDGFYRITFSNMTDTGFEWIGEWVNTDETVVYPTWKISCTKIK